MKSILQKHQAAFSKDLPRRSAAAMKNAIRCKITLKDPNCRPIVSRERRRSPKDVQTLIDAVKEMEAAGLIQKSDSPWSSQAVLVAKVRDGVVLDEKRPCWDLRGPNSLIVSDAHPLPLPEDLFDKLQGSRLFSKMDLTKGFWQIPLEEASKKILAMATPLGLYEPNCMPFGMKNAPAVFQREMQRVLRDRLYNGVIVFVDDILIYSKTAEEHAELVDWVLQRLEDEGYYAHPDKCEFFESEVSFLGHVVSEKGLAVQQYKVKAVRDWPQPHTKKEVRSFLGLTGYYRKFIKQYSELALPLTDLTRDDTKFEWGGLQQEAFDGLKERLTTADVLAHPDPDRPYILATDASGFAISGVLMQDQADGSRRPVAFYSKKMNGAEMRYPVHEQELLAVVGAVEHWRCYLEGSAYPLLIHTDHRSLQYLNTQPHLSARQSRWVEKLSEFEFVIQPVAGKTNVVADALSRRADYEAEAEANEAKRRTDTEASGTVLQNVIPQRVKVRLTCVDAEVRPLWETRLADVPLLQDLRTAAKKDEVYQQRLTAERDDGLMVGDGLLWTCDGLYYVPDDRELQQRLIREVHDTPTGGHMGLKKTLRRLMTTCWWPGMKNHIADYVMGCITCASTKPSLQKPAGKLHPLPIPARPWQVISIDFVGPLPMTTDWFDYVLVVVDKFSKMGHFIATTSNVTAKKTAELLIDNVIRLHGIPEAIISDRGTQFTAELFRQVWKALGTELRMSTSYHPQSDGQTERTIRELEHQLRIHANRSKGQWKEWLSVVEMHYNSDVHESTGKTPYELNGVSWRDAFALAMRKPTAEMTSDGAQQIVDGMKAAWEDARQVMLRQREQQKKFADKSRRDERYSVGDLVMLSTDKLAVGRGKLADRYVGPFRVEEVRDNGVNVRLALPKEFGRLHPIFHIEKLKKFTASKIDWPGRVQIDRPPPVMVDGERQYWALRIIGKKEEQREELVPEEVDEQSPGGDEKKDDEEIPQQQEAQQGRRISPRGHASTLRRRTRSAKRRKIRKVERVVVLYLVEWEGYEEATWERADQLVKDGAQDLIDDYERRQLAMMDSEQVALATVYTYSATRTVDGELRLSCERL